MFIVILLNIITHLWFAYFTTLHTKLILFCIVFLIFKNAFFFFSFLVKIKNNFLSTLHYPEKSLNYPKGVIYPSLGSTALNYTDFTISPGKLKCTSLKHLSNRLLTTPPSSSMPSAIPRLADYKKCNTELYDSPWDSDTPIH